MRPAHIRLICTITLLTLASCGGGIELLDQGQQGNRQRAIVNGQPDSGHLAVGLLKSNTAMGYAICTATLVGRKTVLTAAHCVDGVSSASFTVGGQTYGAAQLIKHPSYTKAVLNANDVAVVILGQEVSGVQPVPLAQTAPAVGQAVTVVGYGITSSNLSDAGTKRVTHNAISKVSAQYFSFSGAGGAEGNVCQGDSGGPSFRVDGGKEVLIGVHSTASVPCGYAGNDMRVDAFYSWIASVAGGDLGQDTQPPSVSIVDPATNASVAQSFTVKVTATDSGSGVVSVKLFVDGNLLQSAGASPASFPVSGLSPGAHNLRADATDQAGNTGSTLVQVTVQAGSAPGNTPGTPPSTSPGSPAPAAPGSFGASCSSGSDCATGLCANDSYTQTAYCTRTCDSPGACPSGTDCIPAGSTSVCALASGGSSNGAAPGGEELLGSCSVGTVGQPAPLAALWPLLGLLGLALLRRSRRLG